MTSSARNSRELPVPISQDESTCETCGCELVRRWTEDGRDYVWIDRDGKYIGGRPPEGFANGYEWLDWLRHNDIARYSIISKSIDMGWLWPWEHRHTHVDFDPYPGEVPECCDWPMQLVRDGWLCRVDHRDTVVPGGA